MGKYDCTVFLGNGYEKVERNGKWAVRNPESKEICDFKYDDIGELRDGYMRVTVNGEQKFIDTEGREYDENMIAIWKTTGYQYVIYWYLVVLKN